MAHDIKPKMFESNLWNALNEAAEQCGDLRYDYVVNRNNPDAETVQAAKDSIATVDAHLEREGIDTRWFWEEIDAIISIRSGLILADQ